MRKQMRTLSQLTDSRLLYEKKLPEFGYMIILAITFLMIAVVIWSIKTPKTYMINAAGIVQSENKNYVMSPYTGEISEIYIEEGTLVEKGDELLRIKSTDMNLQAVQIEEQMKTYENKITQYQKLVQSIKEDINHFDSSNPEDSLYYSQYETYKSQVAQNQVDVTTYQAYGYTPEQIENQLLTNQAKITELYHSAIQNAESAISEAKTQLETLKAQQHAVSQGQEEYIIKAAETGTIHMLTEYKTGMVVQAASPIASIASQQDVYEIVAYVSPQDTARTKVGDEADIAVSGLNQSIYGTIKGRVTQIDSDITTSQNTDGGENSSYFKVKIEPETTYLISNAGNQVTLSNGMAVETRIQYDEVSYFYYVMEALGVLTR